MRADEEEFRAFVTARMDRWRRSAYLMCQDWHTADDLVGVTVAKLYRNWSKTRRADNPDAFAQRILTRSWLDERRRPWRRERLSEQLPDPGWTPPTGVDDRATLSELLRAVGPRQRAVLVLRFYLDLSVEETADILRVSPGTVKSQSARGLSVLRALATPANNLTGKA